MALAPIMGSSSAPPRVETNKLEKGASEHLLICPASQRNEHMKRVSVVERISGCPLYDQVWDWRVADQTKPSSVSGLIHFFLKFGDNFKNIALERTKTIEGTRELEAARDERVQRVQKVVFDQTPITTTKVRYGHYQSTRRRKETDVETDGALLMFFAYDQRCTACVFVTKDLENTGAALAEAILEQFTTKYTEKLESFRADFEHEAKNPDESLLCERFLEEFKSFGKVVDVLTGEAHATVSGEPRRKHGSDVGPGGRLGLGGYIFGQRFKRSCTTSALEMSTHKKNNSFDSASFSKRPTRASVDMRSSWDSQAQSRGTPDCTPESNLNNSSNFHSNPAVSALHSLQIKKKALGKKTSVSITIQEEDDGTEQSDLNSHTSTQRLSDMAKEC